MKAHLLIGAPGVGKTRRAHMEAAALGCEFVYHLLHQWSDADELFYGVNVVAAVAGDVANVRQAGVLEKAAKASLSGTVVLCLDEIDKCSEATEALLLDFLQYGRVPTAPGEQMQARLENLVVFITTNDQRPLSDALLRRCRRTFIAPLPVEEQEQIIASETGAPLGVSRIAWKAARWVAEQEGNPALSLHEGFGFVREIMAATSRDELLDALIGWAARKTDGAASAKNCPHLAALWSELSTNRRREAAQNA